MSGQRRNLELKVRCADSELATILRRLESLVCAPIQRLHQVDTYLQVARGRLKLREVRSPENPSAVERAELIAYVRPTEGDSRWSDYHVVPVAAHDAGNLLDALLMTHEQRSRVEKVRHVGLVGQTRIHLDQVTGLGSFVELETVVSTRGDEAASLEHRQVIAALGLERFPSVAGSYSDLTP